MDNIRKELQEVGCGYMDWIGLVQDRDRWRTLVSAVMNLRVKCTRPFRRKTKSGFCACAVIFQLAFTSPHSSSCTMTPLGLIVIGWQIAATLFLRTYTSTPAFEERSYVRYNRHTDLPMNGYIVLEDSVETDIRFL